jgi:hypothetical protein
LNEAIEDGTTAEEEYNEKVEELLLGIKSQFDFDYFFLCISFRFGTKQ